MDTGHWSTVPGVTLTEETFGFITNSELTISSYKFTRGSTKFFDPELRSPLEHVLSVLKHVKLKQWS